jgi:hypothetical protein
MSVRRLFLAVAVSASTVLAAGTYVLEARGDVTGSAGGAYAGVLQLSPVPLLGAAWLLLSGIVGLLMVHPSVPRDCVLPLQA